MPSVEPDEGCADTADTANTAILDFPSIPAGGQEISGEPITGRAESIAAPTPDLSRPRACSDCGRFTTDTSGMCATCEEREMRFHGLGLRSGLTRLGEKRAGLREVS
ncbi:MAG: hypothetical protein R2706_19675 [Acidimicrobiales bacterium]